MQLAERRVVRDDWLVGLLTALPALVALLVFGTITTPDGNGYIHYAQQLLAGPLPSGAALLAESPAPISLFRTVGYPALIAIFQSLFGGSWKVALVLFQIATYSLLGATTYRTAILLRLPRSLALLASDAVHRCWIRARGLDCGPGGPPAAYVLPGIPAHHRRVRHDDGI